MTLLSKRTERERERKRERERPIIKEGGGHVYYLGFYKMVCTFF